MNIIAVILIGLFGVSLSILLVGGLLVRADVHRAALLSAGATYPRSRLLDDLRPVQDLVVDFVAKSDPSRQLLDFLGEHPHPASVRELRANLPFGPERVWTAIFISSIVGLIRFGRNGVTLTDAGRAVRAQLSEADVAPREIVSPLKMQRTATIHGVAAAAGTPRPSISAADHQELSTAIAAARKLAIRAVETRPLQAKLMNATIARAGDIPHDLITMNSRAEVVDLGTNERVDLVLVYPADANIAEGRISVFHPLGAAMLGHRVGEEFEWRVPYGTRRFRVAAVQFQPESAFAMAA